VGIPREMGSVTPNLRGVGGMGMGKTMVPFDYLMGFNGGSMVV